MWYLLCICIYLIVVLIWISLMTSNMEYLFMCLLIIFISSFGNTQGQRSPTKMVGGVKSYLDSNPIPNRNPSDQFSSVAQSCLTLFHPTNRSTPGLPVHHQLPESTQTHVHWVGDAIQPSHPLLFPSPPVLNLSQHQGLFKWVSSMHQVAKVLEFQLQYQSFNEYSGLISFRMDWLDLLAVQGTLKSLLQHHSSKASILWCSAFFIVQLSHPYMTTEKTIALTIWTYVGKVMSLFFNMLSRLVITFLPRSKHLLISWLQSPSAVILDPCRAQKKPGHTRIQTPHRD